MLFGVADPFAGAAPLVFVGACTCAGALVAGCSSAAHEAGGFLGGGEALGVSSALAVSSAGVVGEVGICTGCVLSTTDLTDLLVAEATLGAFAERMGMRGTAGIVAVRV